MNIHATAADDYDSPWKEAVEHYFPEFMSFYFSKAHAQIDWSQGYEFLDQELRALSQDAELGKRFVDKLVKMTLLNKAEQWLYIHIEVQGRRESEFAKRIFVYNYRIYDRYEQPVASMAVLADEHPEWRPDYFGYQVLGSETSIRFPIAKITDYHDQLEALLTQDNPFAIITAAHILTQRTRKKDAERYEAKCRLMRLLYQRRWDKQRIIDLFSVLDWLMRLPEHLEQQLWYEINRIERNEDMQYVTSVERMGIAKGRQEGRQEGLLLGEAKMLKKLLERRFGCLPVWVEDQLKRAEEQDLERWGDLILTAPTLDDVFNDNLTH